MKKDIEWLKQWVEEYESEVTKVIEKRKDELDGFITTLSRGKQSAIKRIKQKINQLDEPEVLSQEWIDEHKESRISNLRKRTVSDVVPVEELQDLLVPKKEITEEQVMNWLDNNEFYDHITAETVLGRAVDEGELSYYGTKYSVIETPIDEPEVTLDRAFEEISQSYPMTKEEVCRHLEKFVAYGGKVTYGEHELLSQELPVVPTWFDEWWKDVPRGAGSLFHNIERFYNELYSSGMKEACDYISSPGNKKKLLNIIINELDYEVEEEQKYFVSSRESVGFWFLSKNNDNEVIIGTNKDYYDRKWESLKLTEEEIKDYDSRYWAFAVKVEEMEE